MRGLALVVRGAHIHRAGMFARTAAIRGNATGPSFTIAGGGPVHVLQGLVFDVGVGVGREGPDVGDLFGHVDLGPVAFPPLRPSLTAFTAASSHLVEPRRFSTSFAGNHLQALRRGLPRGRSSLALTKTGMSCGAKPSRVAVCSGVSLPGKRRTFRISCGCGFVVVVSNDIDVSVIG